jgi:hypothetical protein
VARCGGESHLDGFKTHGDKLLPKPQFLGGIHGFYQRLIAISQINRAPVGRSFNDLIGPSTIWLLHGVKTPIFGMAESTVAVYMAHGELLPIDKAVILAA